MSLFSYIMLEAEKSLNKIVLPFLFSAILFASLLTGRQSVSAESADSISFSSGVTLFSPLNRTYNSRYLTLNFSFACGCGIKYSLSYNVDGEYGGPMPYVIKNPEELHVIYYATGLVRLQELSEGTHSLTVNLLASPSTNHIKPSYADTIYFSIDLTPPNVSILSPSNKTYTVANTSAASFPLNYATNEEFSQASYSLDGHDNITMIGNTTLSGLSFGLHNVTVYTQDLVGNTGASETVNFAIAAEPKPKPLPRSEPFPTTLVVAGVLTVAVVGSGLWVYFKKSRH